MLLRKKLRNMLRDIFERYLVERCPDRISLRTFYLLVFSQNILSTFLGIFYLLRTFYLLGFSQKFSHR
jgi:hypothetical protein